MVYPVQPKIDLKQPESTVEEKPKQDALKISQGIEDFKKRRFLKTKKDPQTVLSPPIAEDCSQAQTQTQLDPVAIGLSKNTD